LRSLLDGKKRLLYGGDAALAGIKFHLLLYIVAQLLKVFKIILQNLVITRIDFSIEQAVIIK